MYKFYTKPVVLQSKYLNTNKKNPNLDSVLQPVVENSE